MERPPEVLPTEDEDPEVSAAKGLGHSKNLVKPGCEEFVRPQGLFSQASNDLVCYSYSRLSPYPSCSVSLANAGRESRGTGSDGSYRSCGAVIKAEIKTKGRRHAANRGSASRPDVSGA